LASRKPLSKDLSHDHLKAICRLRPTLADVAAFFDVSEDTIQNRCKEFEGTTFSVFRTKYMTDTRLTLVRNALKMANAGNSTMMIFCLKNIAHWVDKVEVDHTIEINTFSDWARKMNAELEAERKVIDVTPPEKKDD
jgi:AraC-like DNA-binding protein